MSVALDPKQRATGQVYIMYAINRLMKTASISVNTEAQVVELKDKFIFF